MGLLDDAIREHLELKRLKGADPGDVARDEREALGEGNSPLGGEHGGDPERTEMHQLHAPADKESGAEILEPDARTHAGQETVEFDMDSVLSSEGGGSARVGETGSYRGPAAPIGHSHHAPQPEDSLEWEMPGDPEGEEDHDGIQSATPDEEPVEDVLEETPDFLRDTPEQERLWFEQRPPRDFDFDE